MTPLPSCDTRRPIAPRRENPRSRRCTDWDRRLGTQSRRERPPHPLPPPGRRGAGGQEARRRRPGGGEAGRGGGGREVGKAAAGRWGKLGGAEAAAQNLGCGR
ncbi:hypothetical protein GUJ93_ZPchr0001g32605 [Zizania palustris]|uniref:Uncharacterized protein n=1 Tax=Zizania palustris TaxID=103762 RepID=A0A8J5VQ40_ZIZPA|nr:hypothetical protein GUJ93_ZPchr0001g32605 [Zizania palustris]